MSPRIPSHRVVSIPPERRVVLAFLELSAAKHPMHAVLEVDVTRARRSLAAQRARPGEKLSFTGYLVYCLAQAVAADTSVQGYRKGRTKMVLFDDVDVGMMIERQTATGRAPAGYVVKAANRKSFLEISDEIRAAQANAPLEAEPPRAVALLPALPGPLLRVALASYRLARRRDPARTWVAQAGTVAITSVGMFGSRAGWGIAPDSHSLCLIVGGIASKPAVVAGSIEPRDFVSLTVVFDHAVVDGAPAARFVQVLADLIESAAGLQEIGEEPSEAEPGVPAASGPDRG